MKMIPLGGRGNEYLFRPEGSEIIWVIRSKKGYDRKWKSLSTKVPIEARENRDRLFAEWFGEKPKLSTRIVLLAGEHWDEFEKTKARKSVATRDSIKYSGLHLKPAFQDFYPAQINETWWENSYIPKKKEERPDRKFFNEWKWVTSFLKYLHREGKIERMPKLENPDGDTAQGIALTDSEIAAFYEFANPDLALQMDLGLKHFMRRSEALLLPWAEIDFKSGIVSLPAERTKIRKARQIPLSAETLEKLKLRHSDSKSPFVFPSSLDLEKSISRTGNATAWNGAILRANKEKTQINPDATFHDLRHSGLTRAFSNTNRYAEICVVAGLSLAEAQRTYLHMTPEHTRFVSELVTIKKPDSLNNAEQRGEK